MTDVTDPVAAEPPELPVTEATPVPRKASVVPMVAGGLLAAVIGFAAAQVVPNGWPLGDTAALQAQLDAQTAEFAALKSSVAELAQTPAPSGDQALTDRVAALEATPAAADLSPLSARLDALDQAVTSLKSSPASGGAFDPTTLAPLQAQIDALKSGGVSATALAEATAAIDAKLAEAEAKVAAVKADAEAIAATITKRAALHQLQAALDSGAPYTSAVADLADLALPAELADHAASGLPSLQSLRQDFPAAARAALDAALKASSAESWTDRVTTFLRGQTGARSLTPREGNDPDAVLSRAEAALQSGDLTTALTEIAALPSEGQTAMADWLARAQLRQDAAGAVHSLITASGL